MSTTDNSLKKIGETLSGKNLVSRIPNDGILIVVLLLIIIVVLWLWMKPNRKLLKGFWMADADYCEQAGLQYYLLRIGDSEMGRYNAYILAANSQGIIMNNNIELDFGYNPFEMMSERITGKVKLNVLDDDLDEFFLPKELEYVYYPYYGKFVWSFEDSILGIFFRNSSMSSVELLSKATNDKSNVEASDDDSSDDETSN